MNVHTPSSSPSPHLKIPTGLKTMVSGYNDSLHSLNAVSIQQNNKKSKQNKRNKLYLKEERKQHECNNNNTNNEEIKKLNK